ncbi:MAG: hypothetical protein A3J28_00915 [Acidobacteria bacterium RIFCSPLOWO2_12_FULL_60_22]|nr:MAG: hypothetical protein A3J28_00915 [Acidobacteria bacterium RIFCSPLOWO2_12_FULL_60_22]
MPNTTRVRSKYLALLIGALVLTAGDGKAQLPGQERPMFGPVTALRATGKPTAFTYRFPKLPGFQDPFRLLVQNGEADGRSRISSARVDLNGRVLVSPSDLNQQVAQIKVDVQLLESNTLTVTLASAPGGFLKLTLLGLQVEQPERVLDQTQSTIGPGGGSASMDQFASVSLPEVPSRPQLNLLLQKVISDSKSVLYRSETVGAGPSLPELLKITSSVNITTAVAVTVQVPPTFASSLPPGHSVELFALISQIGSEEERISTFERLGAAYDPIRGLARASLPAHAFSPSNSVTTYIAVGSYTNAPTTTVVATNIIPTDTVRAAPYGTVLLAANLTFSVPPQVENPLHANMNVTSDFGPRLDPFTGQPSFHAGLDLDTSAQPVYPVAAGRVCASGPQVPCPNVDAAGVCQSGLGHRVRIDHSNALVDCTSPVTVYGHLQPENLPAVGTQVTTATQIGTSGDTGAATGDHLHLEYRVNGAPVDPFLFIGQQNVAGYLQNLSGVAIVNGTNIEATRRQVNSSPFTYQGILDLVPLALPVGSTNQLSIAVQNTAGASANITTVPLMIDPLALRVTLRWDKYDTDVDLHVRDSLGNESWYGNLCGIPNGCLDRDDVDGFGPEVFDLRQLAPGVSYTVFLHYYSDHGNGPTTATVVVEQGTRTFGPFVVTLSSYQTAVIGVYPQ